MHDLLLDLNELGYLSSLSLFEHFLLSLDVPWLQVLPLLPLVLELIVQLWVCTLVWRIPAQRTKVQPILLKTCLFPLLVFPLLLCRHLVGVAASS